MNAAAAFNTRIRLEGGTNVLAAAQAAGVRRYLRQSIAFWAISGPELADEETPRVVTELEHRYSEILTSKGLPCVMASSMGPGPGSARTAMLPNRCDATVPDRRECEGVWSWLHIEDAAIATVAAAEKGTRGSYLIPDDNPLAVREWLPAFARGLNAPPPPQVSVEDALKTSGPDAVYYGTQM